MTEDIRFHCHGCGRIITTPLPSDAIMRAIAWCPECIEAGRDQIAKFTESDVWLLRLYADGESCKCKYHGGGLASLAERIEALLPPSDIPKE